MAPVSPDLSQQFFCFHGFLKENVYKNHPHTLEKSKQNNSNEQTRAFSSETFNFPLTKTILSNCKSVCNYTTSYNTSENLKKLKVFLQI
jgi:hypothetical protein